MPPRSQDQFFVGRIHGDFFVNLLELPKQFFATIEPHISQQPNPSVQRKRLRV